MTTQGELQTASSTELRDAIQDLPPSAKLVALVLEHEGTLSQQEIAAESLLPERTVRLGLEQLQLAEVIEARTSLQDARKRLWLLPKTVKQREYHGIPLNASVCEQSNRIRRDASATC